MKRPSVPDFDLTADGLDFKLFVADNVPQSIMEKMLQVSRYRVELDSCFCSTEQVKARMEAVIYEFLREMVERRELVEWPVSSVPGYSTTWVHVSYLP